MLLPLIRSWHKALLAICVQHSRTINQVHYHQQYKWTVPVNLSTKAHYWISIHFSFPDLLLTIHFRQCGDHYCGCNELSPTSSPPDNESHYSNCSSTCQSPAGSSGTCPTLYYNTSNQSCVQGRQGILCGNCSEGYAVAINDPDLSCIECNFPNYGVAIFIFLQLVPVLIMLTLLAVFHIKITVGHLSGFVLFSQMVTE